MLLAFANNHVDDQRYLTRLEREQKAVERALELAVPTKTLWNATTNDVLRFLRTHKVSVFHFGGHANGSALVVQDDQRRPTNINASGFADYLAHQEGLELIFLNGCSTAAQVARLRRKAPAVIATSRAIADDVAAEFARHFYEELTEFPLGVAFDRATAAMKIKHGPSTREIAADWDSEADLDDELWPWILDCDDDMKAWCLVSHRCVTTPAPAKTLLLPSGDSDAVRLSCSRDVRPLRLRAEATSVGDHVQWTYFNDERNEELGRRTAPLRKVRLTRRALHRSGTDETRTRDLGIQLSECLLGHHDPDYYLLLRRLFGYDCSTTPAAIAHPVACRIVTRDLELRELPWRLAFDSGRWLVDEGWTFEIASTSRVSLAVHPPSPGTLLVVAPTHGKYGPWARRQLSDIQDLLHEAWASHGLRADQYVLSASSRPEIEGILTERTPHTVYVAAESTGGDDPAVLVDWARRGTEPLLLSWLVPRLATRRVHALYLGGPAPRAISIDPRWSEQIPCIVAPTLGDDLEAVSRTGHAWLFELLIRMQAPVAAAHRVPADGPSLRWATTQVYTGYRLWRSGRPLPPPGFDEEVLRIDRAQQRSRFADRLVQLVRQDRESVVSFVAHGSSDDWVDKLGDQLDQHIEEQGLCDPGDRGMSIHRLHAAFPPTGAGLQGRLDAALRQTIGLQIDEDPTDAVLRLIEGDGGRWSATIIWLDWGQVGVGGEISELTSEDLETWLRLGAQRLSALCPRGGPIVRLISTLAVGLESDQFGDFETELSSLRQLEGIQTGTAAVEALPALKRVDAGDLEQIIRKPMFDCPDDLVIPAARALVHLAKGRYADVVKMIRDILKEKRWKELIEKADLRPLPPGGRPRSKRKWGACHKGESKK